MRYVTLPNGERIEWKLLRHLRRQQIQEARRNHQLTLFELRDDSRPASQKTTRGRYSEPTLFDPA